VTSLKNNVARRTETHAAREKRGQTSDHFDRQFSGFPDEELIALCGGQDAQTRTAAANFLGARKCVAAVPILCERLKSEPALYPRIAVSLALGAIGESALEGLVMLLGRIGKNQHHELPKRGFYKKSFPLPRDLAARTIAKIGVPALPALEKVILAGDRIQVLEAIDGVGYIAFYHHNVRSESVLLNAFDRHRSDELVTWKIVRALQSFPSQRVRQLLIDIVRDDRIPQLRWEAVRSLGQQGSSIPTDVRCLIHRDGHAEVRAMATMFFVGHKK
jgi:hypothetical protein